MKWEIKYCGAQLYYEFETKLPKKLKIIKFFEDYFNFLPNLIDGLSTKYQAQYLQYIRNNFQYYISVYDITTIERVRKILNLTSKYKLYCLLEKGHNYEIFNHNQYSFYLHVGDENSNDCFFQTYTDFNKYLDNIKQKESKYPIKQKNISKMEFIFQNYVKA